MKFLILETKLIYYKLKIFWIIRDKLLNEYDLLGRFFLTKTDLQQHTYISVHYRSTRTNFLIFGIQTLLRQLRFINVWQRLNNINS